MNKALSGSNSATIQAGGDSWNRYRFGLSPHYSPVFIGRGTATSSKHWEAFREGLMDFEILSMLRDRVAELEAKGRLSADAKKAKALFDRTHV